MSAKSNLSKEQLVEVLEDCFIGYKTATALATQRIIEHIAKKQAESRFDKLVRRLAHRKGITDAKGLAAKIGRRKYGKRKFQEMAAKGREKKD